MDTGVDDESHDIVFSYPDMQVCCISRSSSMSFLPILKPLVLIHSSVL